MGQDCVVGEVKMSNGKKKPVVAYAAGIIGAVAVLIGALATTWSTVFAPALAAHGKTNEDQDAKLVGFYALFRNVIEEQRRQVDVVRDDLRELRADLRQLRDARERRHDRRHHTDRPAAVSGEADPPVVKLSSPVVQASLPMDLNVFVPQETELPAPPGPGE